MKNISFVFQSQLPYHTSSIIASTLECCTLPYRMRHGQGLSDLEHTLVFGGRKAVAASVSFPFPMDDRSNLLNTLEEWEGPLLQGMSACCELNHDRVWVQSISARGIPLSKLKGYEFVQRHSFSNRLINNCMCADPTHP
jgi:hypothetical protein